MRWGGRGGFLLCGGNNGLRILAHPQDADLRMARDAHLPNGWGVPVLFVEDRRDIDAFERPRSMDDPVLRRHIREIYQKWLPEIVAQYPHSDPYLYDWNAIFTPIERNVWGDIRDFRLPMYPQFPVGPYFIDFADPVKKLGIDVDSRRYHEDREQDWARQQALEEQGWTIIRIQGRETYEEPDEEDLEEAEALPVDDPTADYANYVILRSSASMLRFVQRYSYSSRTD